MLLLAGTLCGLLSPAAVAMSRSNISSAASAMDVSSDVKDFFTDVLEGTLLGTATVAQMSSTTQRARTNGRVLFVLSGSADFDNTDRTESNSFQIDLDYRGVHSAVVPPGRSAVQPLGP